MDNKLEPSVHSDPRRERILTVGLGDTLKLILLLDGERVRRTLRGVDQLIGQALSNALHITESRLTGARGEEIERLVHTAQGRHINSLTAHSTLRADTGRVLARACVDDSIHEDLDRVGVSKKMNDLEGVGNNADSHELLAIVAAVEHESINKTLDNWHLSLAELLHGVTASRVRREHIVTERNVIRQRNVLDLNILSAKQWLVYNNILLRELYVLPLAEKANRASLWDSESGNVLCKVVSSYSQFVKGVRAHTRLALLSSMRHQIRTRDSNLSHIEFQVTVHKGSCRNSTEIVLL